jgi:hypothetical protein
MRAIGKPTPRGCVGFSACPAWLARVSDIDTVEPSTSLMRRPRDWRLSTA